MVDLGKLHCPKLTWEERLSRKSKSLPYMFGSWTSNTNTKAGQIDKRSDKSLTSHQQHPQGHVHCTQEKNNNDSGSVEQKMTEEEWQKGQ